MAVREHGYKPREVFFKAYEDARHRYGLYGALPHAHFDNGEDLEAQFRHLIELHRVAPAKIVMPIALVEGQGLVGYLARRATGPSLDEVFDRAMGTDKTAARFASLFRRAALDVINTLSELNAHLLSHGDAAKRNIKVSRSGSARLFDPRGYDKARVVYSDHEIISWLYGDIAGLMHKR